MDSIGSNTENSNYKSYICTNANSNERILTNNNNEMSEETPQKKYIKRISELKNLINSMKFTNIKSKSKKDKNQENIKININESDSLDNSLNNNNNELFKDNISQFKKLHIFSKSTHAQDILLKIKEEKNKQNQNDDDNIRFNRYYTCYNENENKDYSCGMAQFNSRSVKIAAPDINLITKDEIKESQFFDENEFVKIKQKTSSKKKRKFVIREFKYNKNIKLNIKLNDINDKKSKEIIYKKNSSNINNARYQLRYYRNKSYENIMPPNNIDEYILRSNKNLYKLMNV